MSDVPVIKSKENAEPFIMEIPICCREGHDDCPHVINRDIKKTKRNIGL